MRTAKGTRLATETPADVTSQVLVTTGVPNSAGPTKLTEKKEKTLTYEYK